MEQKEIERRARRRVRRRLKLRKDEVIDERSHFVNDLGADSLRSTELVMDFEDEFNIKIPDEDAQRARTFGDAVKLIVWIQDGRNGEHPLGVEQVDEHAGPLGTKSMSFEGFGM